MQNLSNFIIEKLNKINSKNINKYSCQPITKEELIDILTERLKEDENADLNDIDVSKITDMSYLFNRIVNKSGLEPKNIDISEWNVSNVENMGGMFLGCHELNCDISNWNVSKVKNMNSMFASCENFDCDLSKWDVSNVEHMRDMFRGCTEFKGKGLDNWNVNKVEVSHYLIQYMFSGCNSMVRPKWFEDMKNKI